MRAHRYAYEQTHGAIPPGLVVLHRCDTPGCVNVEHLRLGTQADNLADMTEKGRRHVTKGAAHSGTHLTEADVRAIRRMRHAPRARLARQFGISEAAVSDIRARRTWKDVDG